MPSTWLAGREEDASHSTLGTSHFDCTRPCGQVAGHERCGVNPRGFRKGGRRESWSDVATAQRKGPCSRSTELRGKSSAVRWRTLYCTQGTAGFPCRATRSCTRRTNSKAPLKPGLQAQDANRRNLRASQDFRLAFDNNQASCRACKLSCQACNSGAARAASASIARSRRSSSLRAASSSSRG